jgi:S-adenosylmethionine-diacylglycerol 3-amino-3-carboxypropyl transferase
MAGEWLSGRWFNFIHRSNLVYNTCWEDPRLDRVALNLGPDDTVAMITSAGCNVLDYALLEPQQIHAVDVNPRQNALLELKIAGIRTLEFDTFYSMFGRGRLERHRRIYRDCLRPALSPAATAYWDRHIHFFNGEGWRPSFYFHGSSGMFARIVNVYIDRVAGVRDSVVSLLNATSVEEQREIYDRQLRDAVWRRFVRWIVGRDTLLSLVGVPRPQRQQVERYYEGGIARFIEDCVETVFACLPIWDNYFWRVYLTGEYSPVCCPEYLKRENFERLKAGLVDRIRIHTTTLLGFLNQHDGQISRFVLLDHMDWLSTFWYDVLQQEWQAIVSRATPDARILWRSGGLQVEYVDPIEVQVQGRCYRVGDLLTYHRDLAAELHAKDRVHTYGSFYIADLGLA